MKQYSGKINYDDYCQYLKILGDKIFTIKTIISCFFLGSIFIYSIIFITQIISLINNDNKYNELFLFIIEYYKENIK